MCHYAHTNTADYQLNHVGKMPLELFYKLMDEIPGNPLISFTGGEPLLHPQIGDMVAYAKRSGCFTTLTTNGWLLAKCAQTLCETGLDVLVVSIDGPADIHDRIRGAGSFKRLTAGLEAILAQGRRPIVFVNMAISNLNYDQMVKMYDFALGWGVDGLNFNHLWFQDPDVVKNHNALDSLFIADEVIWDIEPEAVDPKQIADAFDVIWQRSRFAPIIVNAIPNLNRDEIAVWYKEPEQIVKYRTTRCGWIRLRVWPDGGVRMCRAWQAGNVAKTHAMDIWKGDKFRAFRQRLSKDMLPICTRCCYLAHR
jgi:MoaA/NifB/PqqE/SkfB family radical SAM enzyme